LKCVRPTIITLSIILLRASYPKRAAMNVILIHQLSPGYLPKRYSARVLRFSSPLRLSGLPTMTRVSFVGSNHFSITTEISLGLRDQLCRAWYDAKVGFLSSRRLLCHSGVTRGASDTRARSSAVSGRADDLVPIRLPGGTPG
jgi:hypothetical protein